MPKQDVSAIVSGAGLAASIWTALDRAVRKAGGTDHDIHRLATPDGEETLGKIAVLIASSYSGLLPKGWTVLEDTEGLGEFEVRDLELVPILEGEEESVSGPEMRKRAKAKDANLSLKDGQRILDHQDEIPEECRPYWISLAGTLVRGRGGRLRVPGLDWNGGRWHLRFHWLGRGWYSRARFVRPRK